MKFNKGMIRAINQFNCEMAEEVTPTVDTPPVEPQQPTEPTNDDNKGTPQEPTKVDEPAKGEELPKTPETPTEEKTDEVVEGLKKQIEKLQEQLGSKSTLEQTIADLQGQLNQLKNDSEGQKTKATEFETMINDIVKAKLEAIPEKFRELVPQNISVKDQLDWLNKAETNGLFGQAQGEIEIGKPLNPKNPQANINTANLSPGSILSMAYSSSK